MTRIHVDNKSKIIDSIPSSHDDAWIFSRMWSWTQAFFAQLFQSDDTVANTFYYNLRNKTITPTNVRHCTQKQLICLKEKIQKNPPENIGTQKFISKVFQKATMQAHYYKQSEELQITLWDIYTATGQEIKSAISILAPSGSTEKQEAVREAVTKVFTNIFHEGERSYFIETFTSVPKEKREDFFTLFSPYLDSIDTFELRDLLTETQKIAPEHRADILKTTFTCFPKKPLKGNRRSIIKALSHVEQGQRADVLQTVTKFCPDHSGYALEHIIKTLAKVEQDQRANILETVTKFCPDHSGYALEHIIKTLAKVEQDQRANILETVTKFCPDHKGYELVDIIKALAKVTKENRADILGTARKFCSDHAGYELEYITKALAKIEQDQRAHILETARKFYPDHKGYKLEYILNALAKVTKENRADILQFISSYAPQLDDYELQEAIEAFAKTEKAQRDEILTNAKKYCSDCSKEEIFLIAQALAQIKHDDMVPVLKSASKLWTTATKSGEIIESIKTVAEIPPEQREKRIQTVNNAKVELSTKQKVRLLGTIVTEKTKESDIEKLAPFFNTPSGEKYIHLNGCKLLPREERLSALVYLKTAHPDLDISFEQFLKELHDKKIINKEALHTHLFTLLEQNKNEPRNVAWAAYLIKESPQSFFLEREDALVKKARVFPQERFDI